MVRDGVLVQRGSVDAGGSDDGGFDAFVLARGDALWRTAWWLTGDAHLAEDLVQTALAKSHRAWRRVGPGGFEAYVRRVMVTTQTSWRRRRWRGERPTARLPEHAGPGVDADLRRDLVTALVSLPRGQRAVLALRYLDDLTEQQTSETLGISVGTVKSQASRALRTLRASGLLEHPSAGGTTHD